jgi:hypothetical protein
LVDGTVIQVFARLVTSSAMKESPDETGAVASTPATVGALLKVTVPSAQALVTWETSTAPEVCTRLTQTKTYAEPTWSAVVPAGSRDKSNWTKARLFPPINRFPADPKLFVGFEELT